MTIIKYDSSLMQTMSLFERITHAKIKDCFIDDKLGILTFVVLPGQIGIAVGRHGDNVKMLENAFKKKIKVVEFHQDKLEFIRNMIRPLQVDEIVEDAGQEGEEGIILIKSRDTRIKGLIIGRNAMNLRNLEENVKRYFKINEIRVV